VSSLPRSERPATRALRGREVELAAIDACLTAVVGGRGSAILVDGRGGFGKTRLLEEATALAERRGVAVTRLAPEPDSAPDATASAAARPRELELEALEARLERESLRGPLLVCLDDLQWADELTVLAVRRLPRRLAALPIVWLLAARGDELNDRTQDALAALGPLLERMALGGLAADGVAQVVLDRIGVPGGDELLDLAGQLGGSPFRITELLTGLIEEDLVQERDGRAELVEHRLPSRVRDDMDARLERVTPEARRVARVGAVLGRRFKVSILGLMLTAVPATLLGPIQELLGAGLLIDEGIALAFMHDLIREAVLDTVPPSSRRTIERQAVDTLLASGAPPAAVARQLADSAVPGDAEAVALLHRAAHAVGAVDPDGAAALAGRALELAGPDDPLRGPLVSEIALALHAAGRVDEGRAFADAALGQALPPEQEAAVHLSISGMFTLSNDVRSTAGRRALALPGLSDVMRARLLTRLVHNVLASGRLAEAGALAAEARATLGPVGDPVAGFALAVADVGLAYAEGRYRVALARADAALALSGQADDDARIRLMQQWRAEILLVLDRFDEAEHIARDHLAANQRDGQLFAVRLWEDWRGRLLLGAGRLDDAAAALGSLAVDGEPRPIVNGADGGALGALWRVARHSGQADLTEHAARLADGVVASGTPDVRRHAAWLLAQHAGALDDLAGAREALSVLAELDEDMPLAAFPTDPTAWPQLVRVARAADAAALAARAVAVAEERARRGGAGVILAAARHARGLHDGDADALEDAVAAFAAGPWRLAHASALEDLGRARLARGERDAAVSAWGAALDHYAGCAATSDVARVRGRLRAIGVRRRLVGPARPATGWDALTDSEVAVVRAVSEGLTNREVAEAMFVSPHTVKAHLAHAYAKLAIGSRVELARIVLDRGR
jgi:DNA-binding CsgD family transcriptional regulator/tetratricopeptide (TPR) repeat protein